jgi:hypothetical protein
MIFINGGAFKIGNDFIAGVIDSHLPNFTIRLLYKDGVTPTFSKGTATQISNNPNIWDLTYNNTNWTGLLSNHSDLLEVLGANTTGVTDMSFLLYNCQNLYKVSLFDTSSVTTTERMFTFCYSLTTIPLFDTSKVINAEQMFMLCSKLTSIPLFNTSRMTNMADMFNTCLNVESGALALYQQASSQLHPPSNHQGCFNSCGSNTQSGTAELSQIPRDWGGWGY